MPDFIAEFEFTRIPPEPPHKPVTVTINGEEYEVWDIGDPTDSWADIVTVTSGAVGQQTTVATSANGYWR